MKLQAPSLYVNRKLILPIVGEVEFDNSACITVSDEDGTQLLATDCGIAFKEVIEQAPKDKKVKNTGKGGSEEEEEGKNPPHTSSFSQEELAVLTDEEIDLLVEKAEPTKAEMKKLQTREDKTAFILLKL
jgi:hypothetical protein